MLPYFTPKTLKRCHLILSKQAIIHMSYIILAFGKELIRVGGLVVIHVNEKILDEVVARCPQRDSETAANCLNTFG